MAQIASKPVIDKQCCSIYASFFLVAMALKLICSIMLACLHQLILQQFYCSLGHLAAPQRSM